MMIRRVSTWRCASDLLVHAPTRAVPIMELNGFTVNRNLVERLWNRLKEWRVVATRYEKTARSFTGVLCLAAAFDWIKP
jgi:transposase